MKDLQLQSRGFRMPTSAAGVENVNELLRFGVPSMADDEYPIRSIRNVAHLLSIPLVFDPAWFIIPFIMGGNMYDVVATPVFVTQRQIAAAARQFAVRLPHVPLSVIGGLNVRVSSTDFADADVIVDARPTEGIVRGCIAEMGDGYVFKDVGGMESETNWQQIVMNELRSGRSVMLGYAYSAVANFIFGNHFVPERLRMRGPFRRKIRSLINTLSAIHDPDYVPTPAIAAAAGSTTP